MQAMYKPPLRALIWSNLVSALVVVITAAVVAAKILCHPVATAFTGMECLQMTSSRKLGMKNIQMNTSRRSKAITVPALAHPAQIGR
jgi:hypothetical protein